MNTTTAAAQAGVTVATIRTWCRHNVIAAVKTSGRWVIDTASLAHRIAIGALKATKRITADLTDEYLDTVRDSAYHFAGVRSRIGLQQLLDCVKTRNIAAVMGNIDPRRVHLTPSEWTGLERLVSLQAGCVTAER